MNQIIFYIKLASLNNFFKLVLGIVMRCIGGFWF